MPTTGWFSALLLLLPAATRAQAECFSNLTVLAAVMSAGPVFETVEYTLCPNTVYQVGNLVAGRCCEGGDSPIFLRANSIIKCGDDGALANNCTFIGGQSHVAVFFELFEELVTGSEIRGITFGESSFANLLLASPGSFSLIDCSFSNPGATVGSIALGFNPQNNDLERRLNEYASTLGISRRSRKLQLDLSETILNVTLERCIFEGNTKRLLESSLEATQLFEFTNDAPLTLSGPANYATVKDCIFRNNEYDDPQAISGSCIQVNEGTLTLSGTSFVNNTLKNFGIVDVVNNGTIVIVEGNAFDEATLANVQCEVAIRDDVASEVTECLSFSPDASSSAVSTARALLNAAFLLPFFVLLY